MFDVTVVVFSFMVAVGLDVVVIDVSESEGSNVVAIVVCCVFVC